MAAYCSAWALLGVVQTFVLHRLGLSWKLSMADALISSFLLALTCFLAILIYRFYQPGAGKRTYRLIFAVVITGLSGELLKWTLFHLFQDNRDYLSFVSASMPVRFVFSFVILSFVTVLNWMWNNMMEQNRQETRRNEAEQLVKEAELAKLRQQLQPHFLFNSLNSISALAGSRPDEARKMIQQLSDFLRGTLKKDEQQTVTLKEELDHLRLYLEIEKVRFGHRLNIDIDVADEALNAHIPPLLLQPIVENAIKFGLYGTIDAITVSINAQVQQPGLMIEVKNPYDTQTQGTGKGTGFGLSSVQRRLFLLYSRNDLLVAERHENLFITRLKIPQHT
jgi:hypothetical protein